MTRLVLKHKKYRYPYDSAIVDNDKRDLRIHIENNYSYTKYGYRINQLTTNASESSDLTWIFLPGGSGMGSEAYHKFLTQLNLPGTTLLIDFPNDGSNQLEYSFGYDIWREGLIDLIKRYRNVIIMAHSFAGMFVLTMPELEQYIQGLVIMNSSPNKTWEQALQEHKKTYTLPDTSENYSYYQKNKSNETFKSYVLSLSDYYFSNDNLEIGKAMLEGLPYSHESYDWAADNFHPTYDAAWAPSSIPCLIIGSDMDHLVPIKLFKDDKRFEKDNIDIVMIKNASHYPWLDNFFAVQHAINCFYHNKIL